MNWYRGLWRAAIAILVGLWLFVIAGTITGDIREAFWPESFVRLVGLSACYLIACKLIEWIARGFIRPR